MMTLGSDKSKDHQNADGQKRRGSFQGIVEKGKEMLGMGKPKQHANGNGGAVAVEK